MFTSVRMRAICKTCPNRSGRTEIRTVLKNRSGGFSGQKEANTIAAQALTTADQTKQELKTLAQESTN